MNAVYPALYTDASGSEQTSVYNDGKMLRMIVRGLPFVGSSFDDFWPEDGLDIALYASFGIRPSDPMRPETFGYPVLSGYLLDCEMPVPMVVGEQNAEGTLHIHVDTRSSDQRDGLSREEVRLTLAFEDQQYSGSGRSEWFEDELLEIQATLPSGVYMKACINCAFSDYSPYGHQVFGDMACYRDNKQNYLAVKTKRDIFDVRATDTVQETFLCPEFQRRLPGTGYRG
jgi:hypothetical protein